MLLPFFEWSETVWLGRAVVGSLWLFPVIEAVHLLALSVLGGAVLVVDLRMLGLGLRSKSADELWQMAKPWMIGSLVVMIATGIPLFFSEPLKLYYSPPFWVKITTLPFAIAFTFAVRPRFTIETVRNTARRQMLVGALSIALWVTVAAAGRWIGFS